MRVSKGLWHSAFGRWWMLQWWPPHYGVSFGIHVDPWAKVNATNGERFGPYVDVHLGFAIVSVGVNPVWSSELGQYLGRGGDRGTC